MQAGWVSRLVPWPSGWRDCDAGVRAGPDPCDESTGELGRTVQRQAAVAQCLAVAGALEVDVDQAGRVGAGDDVFDVPGSFGAQLRVRLAQQKPVAVCGPVPQLKPHNE